MGKRIAIIGGGTGGTLVANRLRRRLDDEDEIVVIDRDDEHVYQPGLLFVPFGLETPEGITRSRGAQLHDGVEFRLAEVDRVETADNAVHLAGGETIPYDALVVASGAALLREETEGLLGPGWHESVHAFYSPEDAAALRDALAHFGRGRLVVNPIDMPIKCPVAPLEFTFLADWFLRERGLRDQVEIVYATPLDAAFTKPVAAEHLGGMLESKEIRIEPEFATGRVDGAAGKLVSWDEREIEFDLLVTVPLHGGAPFVADSPGLGDDLGFVAVDIHTLQSKAAAERLRDRRRRQPADLEGRLLDPLRGRDAVRQRRARARRRAAAGQLRRPRQLLHRERLPQGAADRLRLRARAAAGPLPRGARRAAAAAARVAGQPPRQARLPAAVLAHAAARPRDPRHRRRVLDGRQAARPRPRRCELSTATYAGATVDVDAEGFLTDPQQWNEQIAAEIAAENGIAELTDRHWLVVNFMRNTYLESGSAPSIRTLGKASGVPIKELYQLFPKGPAKLAAKIAGIPKPRGCI